MTVSPSLLSQARQQVRNTYGKALEAKASDALVLSIAQPLALAEASRRVRTVSFAVNPPLTAAAESLGGAAALGTAVRGAAGGPATAILELAGPSAPRQKVAAESVPPGLRKLSDALAEAGAGRAGEAAALLRRLGASEARETFYRLAGPLREQLGRMAGSVRPESLGPGVARPVTEICWLNASMRTICHLPALAEVAADPAVQRIGLPRLLRRDAAAKAADPLDAAAFRKRTHRTGKGIVVAVLDGEIAYKHKAFHGRVVLKENYTREPWGHPDLHGTAVAGLIAASAPAFTGIAPEVTIYCYKVLTPTDEISADDFGGALAIQQALEDGARIANCSWGIGPAGDGKNRFARAFDTAWRHGLAIVKSAGNEGKGGLTSPADARGAIVVGATDRAGRKMLPESSRGPAPNGRIPDCIAPGGTAPDSLTSARPDGKVGRIGEFGTSFAAPQVAGLVALLLEEDPEQTPDQLRAALLALCHKLPGIGAGAQGHGLPRLG